MELLTLVVVGSILLVLLGGFRLVDAHWQRVLQRNQEGKRAWELLQAGFDHEECQSSHMPGDCPLCGAS